MASGTEFVPRDLLKEDEGPGKVVTKRPDKYNSVFGGEKRDLGPVRLGLSMFIMVIAYLMIKEVLTATTGAIVIAIAIIIYIIYDTQWLSDKSKKRKI